VLCGRADVSSRDEGDRTVKLTALFQSHGVAHWDGRTCEKLEFKPLNHPQRQIPFWPRLSGRIPWLRQLDGVVIDDDSQGDRG
jgi:hypothetical protein